MLTAIILIADHVMHKNGRNEGLFALSILTVLLDFALLMTMLRVR